MRICVLGDARSIHLQRNLSGLAQRGCTVVLLTHHPAPISGVAVERFQVPPAGWRYPARWKGRWRKYLRKLLREFDVVNVQFLHDWGLTAELIQDGCVVMTPWGSDIVAPPGETPPTAELVRKRVDWLQSAAAVTAWGPTFAGAIAEYAGINVGDVTIIPLGVDEGLFRPPDRVTDGATGGPTHRVGFFKGFRRVYGATYLVRAIPSVLEVLPGVRFIMIGDGPDLPKCLEMAAVYEVEHAVKWIKPQPHRNLPNYLAGWDLSVISSICESFGVSALESCAMQVPVVATDVGGVRDAVVDGRTGVLVPPASPEATADAIVRLLQNPPRRRAMGEAGRAHVLRHFRQEDVLDRWIGCYERARESRCVMM